MALDVPSMVFSVAVMQLICGALLIYISRYFGDGPAGYWWGASHIVLSFGVALSIATAALISSPLNVGSLLIIVICGAMQWHGTRHLTGARTYPVIALAGPIFVLAAEYVLHISNIPVMEGLIPAIVNLLYIFFTIKTLAYPATERLTSFRPMIALSLIDILAVAAIPFSGIETKTLGANPLFSIGGFIYIEAQIFVFGTTLFVAAAMRERQEQRSKCAAATDPLTGLTNRRGFFDNARRTLQRSLLDNASCTVVIADLDNFKQINDTHGHALGDQVLRIFANTSLQMLRPKDLVGRIGGEEFAIILPRTNLEEATFIAERLRDAFQSDAQHINGVEIGATMSAGIACASAEGDLEGAIRAADAALYRAKERGRNRVETAPQPIAQAGMTVAGAA